MLIKLFPEFLASFTASFGSLAFHFSFRVSVRGSTFCFALSLCSTMEQIFFACGVVWFVLFFFTNPELVAICMW